MVDSRRIPDGTLVPIGRGAMGTVHRVHDPQRGEDVAIKLLSRADEESWSRLRREAAAQSSLEHPGIVPVYGYGVTEENQPFIIMRLINGRPLSEVLPEIGLEKRIRLLAQVCDAVAFAHAAGLVHRDLKPGNILVEETETGELHPVLTDFGLVRSVDDTTLTVAGQVMGTPAYMSPEQARGEGHQVDRRSDVYSLGCVLYECLTGRPPFRGENVAELIAQITSVDAPSPRRFNPTAPRGLCSVCLQCLEKDPERRYASAAALGRDLRAWLEGGSVAARAVGPFFYLLRNVRRNRTAWLLGGVLSLALLATLGWGLWTRITADQRELEAAQFAARIEQVINTVRVSRLAPLHEIGLTHDRLALELEQLESVALSAAGAATLRAHRSLADAWLTLDRSREARRHLERYLGHRPDDPVALRLLGRALAMDFERIARPLALLDAQQRDELLADARNNLLQPATEALRRAEVLATQSAPPDRARLRILEGDYAGALETLADFEPQRAGDTTHLELAAEALLSRGRQALDQGDLDAAGEDLDAALGYLDRAVAVARSDPGLLMSHCQAARERLGLTNLRGDAPPASPDQLSPSCSNATRAIPDRPGPWQSRALVWEAIAAGHDTRNEGDAARAALDRAIADSRRALETAPGHDRSRLALARAQNRLAGLQPEDPQRAQALWGEARDSLESLLTDSPENTEARVLLADVQRNRGRHRANHGQDPDADYQAAVNHYRAALRLRPDSVTIRDRLSLTLIFRFYQARDAGREDAAELAREAIAVQEELLRRRPEHPDALFTQGANHADLWLYLLYTELNPVDPELVRLFEQAHSHLAKLRDVAPDRPQGYVHAAMLHITRGEFLLNIDRDATQDLEATRQILEAADARGIQFNRTLKGWYLQVAARQSMRSGEDPAAALATAHEILSRQVQDPDLAGFARSERAELAAMQAAWLYHAGQSPLAVVEGGLEDLEVLLAGEEVFTEAICAGGELHRIRALWWRDQKGLDQAANDADRSVALYERCLDQAPVVLPWERERLEEARNLVAKLTGNPVE